MAASYPVRDCDDATLMARDAFEMAKDNIFETLQNSNHFKRLASKGGTKDIAYCCEVNVLHIVPVLKEGKLVIA